MKLYITLLIALFSLMVQGQSYVPLDILGGLYRGGSNDPPAFYQTQLDDANISLDNGEVVFLGLGASSPERELNTLMNIVYPEITDRNTDLVFVNGNKGGTTIEKMLDNWNQYFSGTIEPALKSKGVTASEVDIIWLKSASVDPITQTADQYVADKMPYWIQVIGLINTKFPNCKIIYLSSKHWGTLEKHAEPEAYYTSLIMKEIIDERINGEISGALIAWAHPFHTGGSGIANSYGHIWYNSDLENDGVHPTAAAQIKVANYMDSWYRNTSAKYWWTNADFIPEDTIIIPPPPDTVFAKSTHNNVGFQWQNGFDFTWTNADYSAFINLVAEGDTIPLRVRIFDKDSNMLRSIDRMLQLNDTCLKYNRTLQVVFCIDVETDVHWFINYLDEFAQENLNVIAIEGDNEYYFAKQDGKDHSIEYYLSKMIPFRDTLLSYYPTLPFIHPTALARPGKKNKYAKWETGLIAYMKTAPKIDGVVLHFYPNEVELPVTKNILVPRAYNYPALDQSVNDYYAQMISEFPNAYALADYAFNYLQTNYSRDVWVTEFSTPTGEIKNSLAFSSYIWELLNRYEHNAKYWFYHNGFSPPVSSPGVRNNSNRADVSTGYVNRSDYYVIQMFRNMPADAEYFNYVSGSSTKSNLPNSNYLSGQYNYSSSGFAPWMDNKTSKAGYEIDGIKAGNNPVTGLAFGYYYPDVITACDTFTITICDTVYSHHIEYDTVYPQTVLIDTIYTFSQDTIYSEVFDSINIFKKKNDKVWGYMKSNSHQITTIITDVDTAYNYITVIDTLITSRVVQDVAINCREEEIINCATNARKPFNANYKFIEKGYIKE
ncbi:MAG: hypothetical protein KA954_11990 [Chitinophagales bacterium]|nr:hypothetical protein [Chitinophagales bacterium]MBP8754174.1 hypothetical protein [Chitinophagales bacterium]MBP9549691.1 hypothetical protein [Chitinophagales bacterium]MBP9704652.1 hypothetical protein [Chitinophagales bacterium]